MLNSGGVYLLSGCRFNLPYLESCCILEEKLTYTGTDATVVVPKPMPFLAFSHGSDWLENHHSGISVAWKLFSYSGGTYLL